jgi:NADPH:quinone reductase-like Zn-dependent oxidoreductase
MKAVVRTKYGPPDVLRLGEVERPIPKADEVLVRVHATTVNRTDCGVLRAKPFFIRFFYGLRKPKHRTLGNEFAGQVAEVGSDVDSFAVGDRVFGYNDATFGAQAEYLAVPQEGMLATIPVGMTYEEAAPTAEGAHYALGILRKARVASGQRVLVYGATGAIGSAAVQLAKHFGATVTGVCRTERVDLVTSLGADRVIDRTKEDFTKAGQEYDLVLDAVGMRSFRACKKLLKPGGIYCSTDLGFLAQNPVLALWTARFGSRKVIFPIPTTSRADMDFLNGLIEAGEFKPIIDRRYPLEQIVEAFRYVEQGHKTGNVVVTLEHTDAP